MKKKLHYVFIRNRDGCMMGIKSNVHSLFSGETLDLEQALYELLLSAVSEFRTSIALKR